MKANLEYIEVAIVCEILDPGISGNVTLNLNLDIVDVDYTNKTLTLKVKSMVKETEPITFIIHQKLDEKTYISNITMDYNNRWIRGIEDLLTGDIYNNDFDIIQKLDDSVVSCQYIRFIENCDKMILNVKDDTINQQEIIDALINPNNQIFEFEYLTINL